MRKPARTRNKGLTCQICGAALETPATVHNPTAKIQANSLARCPSCLTLVVIDADLSPILDLADEDTFNAAMNSSPELREMALITLETMRIRSANESRTECTIARERLIARGGPNLVDELATLDAYAAGYDEKGWTSATIEVRKRAAAILGQVTFPS